MSIRYFIEDYERSPKLYNAEPEQALDFEAHPAVTIETTDNFRLTADLTSLHICMRKTSELSETSEYILHDQELPVICYSDPYVAYWMSTVKMYVCKKNCNLRVSHCFTTF